ncbi:MAG: hypothetical protein KKD29_00510 [Candidatus Omnitrophica bacterium]|nr:hypothetical protein [Candidatus Omnitrophota bacterium]MBU4488122.1 hypothetical protein [Candidatus Omnitrophota bacterium]
MNFKNKLLFLNKSAFTMTEIMMASTVLLLGLVGVVSLYVMVLNINDVESIRAKELNDGALIMQKILRGVGGNNGLREAVSFSTVTNSSDISYIIPGGETRRFYLSNGNLYYGPSGAVIGDDVSAFNVTATTDYADISITFSKIHRGKTYSFSFFESVWPRNSIRSWE